MFIREFSVQESPHHEQVHLEMPCSGGPAGFIEFNKDKSHRSEGWAMKFLQQTDAVF